MDERRRHAEPSGNQLGMEHDIGLQLQREDMSYIDQLLQRDRNEQFVDRTTNRPSMYGHHSGASYYGTHGNQGSSYANWQSQAGNLSNPPNMYSSQTYPNYPSYNQSRFVSGQPTAHLPYPGYGRYDNVVDHRSSPLHVSQSLPSAGPSDRNTVDSRQNSWNNESYGNDGSSRQASAQGYRSYSTTYGTTGSKIDVGASQIPQGTLSNNYSANSEVRFNNQSIKGPYDRVDRNSMPMNYQAPHAAQGMDYHSDSRMPKVSMPPPSTQKHLSDSCQTNLEPPINLPLPESTSNSMDSNGSVPTLSQRGENVSDDGCKQHEHYQIASCPTGQKTEKTLCNSEHSSHSVDEKVSLSSTQHDVKTYGANCDHVEIDVDQDSHQTDFIGQGDDREGTPSVSQESLDHIYRAKISKAEQGKANMPADSERSRERTNKFEKVSTACKSDQNTKMEATEDTVNSLPESGSFKNTSSDLPVSATPCSQDTSTVWTDAKVKQGLKNVEGASHQNLQKENCDDNVNVKEVSAPKDTHTTVRTTVDLSAAEQGCSTVVKFEDGTCKYIKGEPRSEQDEESFYRSSQQGRVPEPKVEPSEEDNLPGIQGVKDHLPIIKQEVQHDEQQQRLGSDSTEESLKDTVKLEVEDRNRSQSQRVLNTGVSDASRHGATPLKASDVYPDVDHIESNYDSDGWQVGSDKQDLDSSSKCSTTDKANDDGMLDRCPMCNELIACSGMIEHSLKCKAEPNVHEAPFHLQPPNDDEAVLKCPECGVGFQTTDDLVIHLRIHEMLAKSARKMKEENRMMLMTEEMGKQMTDMGDMTEEQSEECKVCYQSFTDPTMIPYHNMMHQQFPFHCRKCNLFFSSLTELHKSRCSDHKHHKVFKYRCGKCKGALLDSYKMRKHRKRCEGKMETCRLCQKKFSSFKQLALHAEICNEEQKKKEMEKDGECSETVVAMEETVPDIEVGDGKAVDHKTVGHKVVDHDAVHHPDLDPDTLSHEATDLKAADPTVADQDVSLEIKSDSRPIVAEIREPICQEKDCADGIHKATSPENAIEINETSQLSEENSSVARCKVCEKELPISLRFHGRACKETPEYCKACLNMVKTTKVTTHEKSSASQKSSLEKRKLPIESSSSVEETCENAIVEPSTKKHKKERQVGETCGACGKWFKNFKKLEKHAARCDGVENKRDRGACPEPTKQPNDDINLEWKCPTVLRCPKCEKKFVKEEKLKKHVKSCGWIQDGTPSTDIGAVVDDPSDLEDELPLSAIRNVNCAAVEYSGRENASDTVEHPSGIAPMETIESPNESSKVERTAALPCPESTAALKEVDKGESDQNVGDMLDKSAEVADRCISNGSMPSFQNEISFSEKRIEQDAATSEQSNNGNYCNLANASGASERKVAKESSVVDTQGDSTEQPLGMETSQIETSQISNCDDETEISSGPPVSSAQQVTLGKSESDTSSSKPFIVVPAQDKPSPTNISHEIMSQEHLTRGEKSGTVRGENVIPPPSASDTNPRKDVLSFTQAMQKPEMNTVDSVHSAPQEISNANIDPSLLLASSLSAGADSNEEQNIEEESESTYSEINMEAGTDLGEKMEGKSSTTVGKDIYSCPMDEGVINAAEPEQVSRVIDKVNSLPVLDEAVPQIPGQSTEHEGTTGSVSQLPTNLQRVHAAQARSTAASTHQGIAQTVSFKDNAIDNTKASFELMSGIEGKSHFLGLRDESSMDSSVEVEYAMSLGAVKAISLECEVVPSHHCVYCAAEFSSRDDLWKHAGGCRDNHLMVIASHVTGENEYQLVEKPVTWGSSVPWRVLNDYSKKEAIVMRNEIGIDLSCVIPTVGYIAPSNKPVLHNVKNNKKRKKKKKIKDKEEMEKEKKRKIDRKKRRRRERKREKLLVQAKLQQLEQNPGKKVRDKEKQKKYTCELCNRHFHSREKFEKHKLNHVSHPNQKTLAVCVEKLNVKEIDNHKEFNSTTKHSGAGITKLKEKEFSKKKYSKVTESQSITKKKTATTKNRPAVGKEENEKVYVDVEGLQRNDKSTEQAQNKKRSSKEAPQGIVNPIQTFAPHSTTSGSMESIQQAEIGSSQMKSKGTIWKKNEFGVQYPVVIEVECPDCLMKFSHQSTLERHRRLHRK